MSPYLESFCTVRFSDCDPFRHLNNARYIDYFLNAREDHLRDYYQMELSSFYKKGTGWVVLRHDITYLRPASHSEKICIRTGLLSASPEHLLAEMLMMDENKTQLKAILHTQFIPVSLTTGKKELHTPEFMEFISAKVIPGLDEKLMTMQERIIYWQSIIKPEKNTSLN
jgi:YbgC/YbaW family acyl-CoA thioester hydrolase